MTYIAAALFFLNDFLLIARQKFFYDVVLIDYGTRFFALFLIFKTVKELKPSFKFSLTWTFIISAIGIFHYEIFGKFVSLFPNPFELYTFPDYPNKIAKALDLTLGLLLVAISEEVIFRKLITEKLLSRFSELSSMLLSCFIFSLIHWSAGLHALIMTFLWAIFPTYYFIRHRKLTPCVIAHFLTNFVIYSKI